MSQLDEAILDALTHVTFPKGFAQAEPAWGRQLRQTGRGTGERWGDGSRHRLC